jgi:excisionase family DNA binding protein
MSELRTIKQLQELLMVDRITIYRMLNDGRLNGIKIGNQWRFSQSEIDRLLGVKNDPSEGDKVEKPVIDFPVGCIQKVQEIFAGILEVGTIVVTLDGDAMSEFSYANPFCKLILSSPKGQQACRSSWHKIALHKTGDPSFQICHAGLCYLRSIINIDDQPAAWFITGQFYTETPDSEKEQAFLEQIAYKYDMPLSQIKGAAKTIPVLKQKQQSKVQEWAPKVANTIQSILCERSNIINRLQRIAEISTIHPAAAKYTET